MKVSIVGFGRFGQTLLKLIKDDFDITIYDKYKIDPKQFSGNVTLARNIAEIYKSEAIFYCVPISVFESLIASQKKYFSNRHTLIDVLSVKMYPAKIFSKYLKGSNTQALLTHPMFGPDSSKNGFKGLPIVIDRFMADDETYGFWRDFFKRKALRIIEMSAKYHDKLAANSQGLTHFIGRLLNRYNFKKSSIDSLGTDRLLEVVEQTCHDTWQLFTDLQHFNPYTKQMRIKLGQTYDMVYNKLLPKQINPNFLTFGIQGGIGSFNEEALQFYLNKEKISKFKIKYLYTAKNVLHALNSGDIDRGQVAIHNSMGGMVGESIEAMSKYKFKIIEEFAIKISHALMMRSDSGFADITTIMTHPQVFAQCRQTLLVKYPNLKQVSGGKELIDHSMVAKYLSERKLPKNIATMGSRLLAEIYDLQILEDNLQDAKENYTSFLQIARI